MSDREGGCRGAWEGYSNACRCQGCRQMEQARSDYISANERVHRLERIGAEQGAIDKALQARTHAGKRWEALGKANPDYGKQAGPRFVPDSARHSRPHEDEAA